MSPTVPPYSSGIPLSSTPPLSLLSLLILFPLTMLLLPPGVGAQDPGICPSLDIRNTPSSFSKLINCRLIEGSLQVNLIESANYSDFKSLSFPFLREITGFLIFYRVGGLKSIGALFPGLRVIRGSVLTSMDFGLIVDENPDLEEIALPGLKLLRGRVAVVKNPRLCYLDTINWDLVSEEGGHFLVEPVNGVPHCGPSPCSHCPSNFCWNRTLCQEPIKEENCHEECIGGCTGPGPGNCNACKNFLHNGVCIHSCPPGKFKYLGRHCLSKEACRKKVLVSRKAYDEAQWFTWKDFCIKECPKGTLGNVTVGCTRCAEGRCYRKYCGGAFIDSLQRAQNMTGCTHLNGSLIINLRDESNNRSVGRELERTLGSIEYINGALKIIRSVPLVNLNFLGNLKVIGGNITKSSIPLNGSLVVLGNDNLEKLWDWDKRPAGHELSILKGRLNFHYNPNLCLKHIEDLAKVVEMEDFSHSEVSPTSNGAKFACSSFNLTLRINKISPNSIVIGIRQPKSVIESQKYLSRYYAYYTEAPTGFVRKDSFEPDYVCDDNGWRVIEIKNDNVAEVTHIITKLKPYMLYAIYVRTYTVGSTGGISPIQYVRTLSSRPSFPTKLKAHSNSSSEIVLSWEPPTEPNGRLTEYIITGTLEPDDPTFLLSRDYCNQPVVPEIERTTDPPELKTFISQHPQENCCQEEKFELNEPEDICENYLKGPKLPSSFMLTDPIQTCEKYVYDIINANNFNQNNVTFIKSKRSTDEKSFKEIDLDDVLVDEGPCTCDDTCSVFTCHVSANTTIFSIRNLQHFTTYVIEVKACRAKDPNEENEDDRNHDIRFQRCSHSSVVFLRTQRQIDADKIDQNSIKVTVHNRTAVIWWSKPRNPNSLIVSYGIEHKRTDIENSNAIKDCITAREFELNNGFHSIKDLDIGEYSFRIQAVSLYGEGEFSDPLHFVIFIYSKNTLFYTVLGIVIFITVISSLILSALYYKKKMSLGSVLVASVNPEYMSVMAYFEDEWEICRDDVEIVHELKQGNFGVVYEGILRPENRKVAIKTALETNSMRDNMDFLNEASVMKSFKGAAHIVNLLGVVSKSRPPLVIMELMALGDLKSYLRMSRDSPQYPSPSTPRLLLMAAQIADGMAFLESRKFVHRDLAARNCMVSEDLTVKIGDFGMTRDVYETDYYRKGNKGLLPIRWMAPESLNDGVFTSQSDVWSFGIVLWEMVTLAAQPYQGMSNEQVLQYVITGNKLETPIFCPQTLKSIMSQCWKWKPKLRPTFLIIVSELEEGFDDSFRSNSYYYSPEGKEARKLALEQVNSDDAQEMATSST